jgi:nicotinamidase-related amidase
VRHTAYSALVHHYRITVPSEAVCAFEGVDEQESLRYLQSVYGAQITTVAELVNASSQMRCSAPCGTRHTRRIRRRR